jgi:hypothetical protein
MTSATVYALASGTEVSELIDVGLVRVSRASLDAFDGRYAKVEHVDGSHRLGDREGAAEKAEKKSEG